MMRKIYLFIFSFLALAFFSGSTYKKETKNNVAFFTDTINCGTADRDSIDFENLPWYDNNDYLEDFLDSINYPQPQNTNGPVIQNFANYPTRYWIPIKFWVLRDDNGLSGPSEEQIRNILRDLNEEFRINNTLMQFYQKCSISYLDNSDYMALSDSESRDLARDNEELGAVNVFLGNELQDNATGVFYKSLSVTFNSYKAVFLSSRVYSSAFYSTFSHEIGHYFGLDHTHQYSDKGRCRKEPIDRNRQYAGISYCKPLGNRIICESTGDALRDTPADPELSTNFSCNYIIGGIDSYGDSYTNPPSGSNQPQTTNLLSYNGNRTCRNNFSRLQVAVMLYSIERKDFTSTAWSNELSLFDTYEPDNTKSMADEILNCETQDRNFHKQYTFSSTYESCDDDWVKYFSTQNGNVEVYTNSISNKPNVNTILYVYDSNNNLISSNDDKSSSNTYSKVSFAATSSTNYFIKVVDKNRTGGYYQLSIGNDLTELQIQGPSQFCTSSQDYNIPNLPTGATVIWGIIPTSGVASLSTSGNTATLTKTGNGSLQLSATVNSACGNINLPIYDVYAGLPPSPGSTSPSLNPMCPGQIKVVSLLPRAGIDSYLWYTNDSGINVSGNGLSGSIEATAPGTYQLKIRAINSCGYTESTYFVSVRNYGDSRCSGTMYRYSVYPNPAGNEVTVAYVKNEKEQETQKFTKAFSMKLYNDKGKEVMFETNKSEENSFSLNTSKLPEGTYFLHITDDEETIKKQIIIKH